MQYLREAIEENYYYEFVVDDIPVRDFVGHLEESGFVPHTHKVFLWTHQHFNILYNDDKVSMLVWCSSQFKFLCHVGVMWCYQEKEGKKCE